MDDLFFKSYVINSMGMPFTVKLGFTSSSDFFKNKVIFENQIEKITVYLNHIDEHFSPFKKTSLVSKFQRRELTLSEFTTEFQEVYNIAEEATTETKNYFDAYVKGVYDPTGVVKKWAIERAFYKFLHPLVSKHLVQAAAINGAGDMQFEVDPETDFKWQIGIEDPLDPSKTLTVFQMATGAIATSGMSKRGEHITRTGSGESLMQASIIAPSLIQADIYATAAISAGRTPFLELVQTKNFQGVLVDQKQELKFL